MPACSRSEIVRLGEVAMYHCYNRCVRSAFLCGWDELTGTDYEYRRAWIRDFEEALAGLFGIEIGFHAEMSNHLHVVLRTRPDVVATWSDEEVVRRWLQVTHLTKSRDGKIKEISNLKIMMELAKPGRVVVLRSRLSNPSFFMAALAEYVGRRSNREDSRQGCFWEGRFGCRALLDESAILICGIYVDLNQIQAGEAPTPEESTHTSAFDRIVALKQNDSVDSDNSLDGWMCELTINEWARPDCEAHQRSATARRASDKGMLPISITDYLELLDTTGRMIRDGKSGSIPASLAPILNRLGIKSESWLDTIFNFPKWFGHFVGSSQALAERANQSGKRWYRGKSHCAAAFG